MEDGDISMFASPRDLERYVESPDIAGYSVFDATGQPLGLQSVPGGAGLVVDVDPVALVEGAGAPTPEVLRDRIRAFLGRLGVVTSEDADLPGLVRLLVEAIGYTK